MNFKFTTHEELEIEINVTSYTPYRPAPYSSNPDSPAYSDPGDDEECDYEMFFLLVDKNKKYKIPVPEEMYLLLHDKMSEEITRQAMEASDG